MATGSDLEQPLSAPRSSAIAILAMTLVGFGLALLAGYEVGSPTPGSLTILAGLCGFGLLGLVIVQPFAGLKVLLASSMMLIVYIVVGLRAVNAFDFLLPPILIATYVGRTRRRAVRDDAAEIGPGHRAIRLAQERLTRAAMLYFGAALLSLLIIFFRDSPAHALDSALLLFRGLEGALLFPICLWWLRSDTRLRQAISALTIGGLVCVGINVLAVLAWHVTRAGLTWVVNDPNWPITSPNEAGTATLILTVLALVRQGMRPRVRNLIVIVMALATLVLTQSRAGLLAWLAFVILLLPRARPRYLVIATVAVVVLLPLVPAVYWTRLGRTIMLQRGTFEAYSILARFYGWNTAWKVFLDHPLFGVGYMGFRFLSDQYNALKFVMITTENYFIEMTVSMGVIGLILLVNLLVAIFRLGRTVGRVAPKGTLAWRLSRYHMPLMVALLVANLTADNFVGMVGICQVALWNAILIRSAHRSLDEVSRA